MHVEVNSSFKWFMWQSYWYVELFSLTLEHSCCQHSTSECFEHLSVVYLAHLLRDLGVCTSHVQQQRVTFQPLRSLVCYCLHWSEDGKLWMCFPHVALGGPQYLTARKKCQAVHLSGFLYHWFHHYWVSTVEVKIQGHFFSAGLSLPRYVLSSSNPSHHISRWRENCFLPIFLLHASVPGTN